MRKVRALLKRIAKIVHEFQRRVNSVELLAISQDASPSTMCKSIYSHLYGTHNLHILSTPLNS
jgi:hypothetical protein